MNYSDFGLFDSLLLVGLPIKAAAVVEDRCRRHNAPPKVIEEIIYAFNRGYVDRRTLNILETCCPTLDTTEVHRALVRAEKEGDGAISSTLLYNLSFTKE